MKRAMDFSVDFKRFDEATGRDLNHGLVGVVRSVMERLLEDGSLKWFYYNKCENFEDDVTDLFISLANERSPWPSIKAESVVVGYWVAFAFKKVWEERLDKDIRVLLPKRQSLIFYDEFGDKIDQPWKNLISEYVDVKVSEPVIRELYLNAESVKEKSKSFSFDNRGVDIRQALDPSFEKMHIESMVMGRIHEIEKEDAYEIEQEENDLDQELEESEGMLDVMSGHEFEHYLANKINNETSMHAEVTQGSGDQGADLVVRGPGFSAVIQAKHYAGKVSNKAIQEAFSARQYYGTGLAIVVANNGYTKSAWQLSERTGVLAMNENSILSLLKSVH
ncbi:MAG: restriction endonuclease, partial [Pseudomonadota bacterium]